MKTARISWLVIALLSTIIGIYPMVYFFLDRRFGLLSTKSNEILQNELWNINFYGHIVFGGLALLIGWLQFSSTLRHKNPGLHRTVGKIYIISVFFSGLCGLFIAFYATGGLVSTLGFLSLDTIWLSTTLLGFRTAKRQDIIAHKEYMIYSYAACFAAVTLRIWLPILTIALGDFLIAYQVVAWWCWVPNIVVAYLIIRKGQNT